MIDEEENSHEQGRAAELLYGMIHARYLLSSQGLIAMVMKFSMFVYTLF